MIADLIGVGARGPLGLSSLQTAMCVRARKMEPRSVSMWDKNGHEVGLCITGGLGKTLYGYQRMLGLAGPAVVESVHGVRKRLDLPSDTPLPVIVTLARDGRPDDTEDYEKRFLSDLAERSACPIDLDSSRLVRAGQAGFTEALTIAKALLDGGKPAVVVGGVDSYYQPGVVKWLDDQLRLLTPSTEDGIIPSEGAAFCTLARVPKSAERLARLLFADSADEVPVDSDEPMVADAMTGLMRKAIATCGPVAWSIPDLNGERHRTREWQLVSRRVLDHGICNERWLTDLGDIGAACGPTFASIAVRHWQAGCGAAPRAVISLHSEGPRRGVLVLESPNGGSA